MNRTIFNIFVGLTFIAALFTSCEEKRKDGRTDTKTSGAIEFASDESFSPLIEEEREIFELQYAAADVTPVYTNELDAINMLLTGKTHLVIAARNFTEREVEGLKAQKFLPRAIKIAYDGLALIVNNANPDSCITVNDIRRILSGEATKWTDVFPNSDLGELDVVFDNPKSSTVHFCVDSILGGVPINSPHISAVEKSAEVINYVSENKNAIGVIGSNWLNDKRDTTNVTFNKSIRVMAVSKMSTATRINSYKPYQYYIYTGAYPLVRTIYALLNDPIQALPTSFAHFLQSPRGQKIVHKTGLLPVMGEMNVIKVNVTD